MDSFRFTTACHDITSPHLVNIASVLWHFLPETLGTGRLYHALTALTVGSSTEQMRTYHPHKAAETAKSHAASRCP